MTRWCLRVCVLGAAAVAGAADLVPNGDLERGAGRQPEAWSPVDGLTVLWGTPGHPGRCLQFDTAVQQRDKQALPTGADNAPSRSPGSPYGTVGAHEGVWLFSAPIPLAPDDEFLVIEADVKGPERSSALAYPQVLIRGYQRFNAEKDPETSSWFQTPHPGGPAYSEQFGKAQRAAVTGDYLMVYRHGLVCRIATPDQWEHFRMAFRLSSEKRFRPDVLLLKPYAMWPLGRYQFDNISLRRVSRAEYDQIRRLGHSAKGFMPAE